MTLRRIDAFIASDGKVFTSKPEAETYEYELREKMSDMAEALVEQAVQHTNPFDGFDRDSLVQWLLRYANILAPRLQAYREAQPNWREWDVTERDIPAREKKT